MSKHTSLSLLWRSASSSGATKVERTLGDDLLAYGTVAPQDLSAGSFLSESRRTRFTSATPGLAGVMSAQAVGARAGASRATGLCFTARFGLSANPGSSRAFVGLSAATSPILGATGGSNPAAANDTIGVGFDDANGMASGNWYLISVDGAGNAWKMDLGARAPRNATDTFLLKLITLPGGTGVLVIVHNLETASLVMAELVEGRVPAAAAFLRVHAQAARYGAGGAAAQLELLSLDHESGFDGTFDVRELGATGDGATDDQPAFQAAIWAASRFVTTGGTAAGGARVLVPPGTYSMLRELHIVGAMTFEGVSGAPDGSSVITFAEDLGEQDGIHGGCLVVDTLATVPFSAKQADLAYHVSKRQNGTAYAVGDLVVQPAFPGSGYLYRCVAAGATAAADPGGWGTAFGDETIDGGAKWWCVGYVPSGAGAILRDLTLKQSPVVGPGDMTVLSQGVRLKARARLENVTVLNFQGDGVEVFGSVAADGGTNCNEWSLGGSSRIEGSGRYGLHVHGDDANSGGSDGTLSLNNNGSFGLRQVDKTGNRYGHIQTDGNGFYVKDGHWYKNGNLADDLVWPAGVAPGTDVPKGTLCVPTLAKRAGVPGFVFRCTTEGERGMNQPAFETAAHVGDIVDDGLAEWTAWMEEGGPIYTLEAAGPSTFERIHREVNQAPSTMLADDMVLGGNVDHVTTQDSSYMFGVEAGALRAFAVHNFTQDPVDAAPQQILQVAVGGGKSTPGLAFMLNASDKIASAAVPDVVTDRGFLMTEWTPAVYRWLEKWGGGGEYITKSVCGGRSLPQAGAACFTGLWLGGQLTIERRLTAIAPDPADASRPHITSNDWLQAQGAYRPGDLVLNTASDVVSDDTVELGKRWPVAWRPKRFGGVAKRGAYAGGLEYAAGDVVYPSAGANGYVYQAQNFGTAAPLGPEPAWTANLGDTYVDNDITWMCVGVAGGAWEPVLTQAPTLIAIDVTALPVDPGAGVPYLSEDESAHERIKIIDTPGNTDLWVRPGPGNGWVRTFWNQNGNGDTVTVKMYGGAGAGVPVGDNTCVSICSDGVDCVHVT